MLFSPKMSKLGKSIRQPRGGSRISYGRGSQPSGGGATTYDFAKFSKTCMKLRKFWAVGGRRAGGAPLGPATANQQELLAKFLNKRACLSEKK